MYRICRFYISDIVAGENILQNGLFPICKEGERADHGVLFAPNGSGKTTLLSFLLSVFCPEQRRFVQHLQSSGDKTMDQYLIPGRPAIVLIDLVTTLEPTLFEAEPEEHLVIGQLLFRHKSATGRIDRVYFTAKEDGFFDTLRGNWSALLEQDQPHAAVRDFLLPQVDYTTSQKEWEGELERLNLDPWLINHQVDFARSEGGIKDAFKFKAESDFLSFFLGCVTDIDDAVKLRSTVSDSIDKMRNRPEKKKQLKAIWNLKERIAGFDEMGTQWRDSRKDVHECRLKLGEASHLLTQAEQGAAKKLETSESTLEKAGENKSKALKQMDQILANTIQVESTELTRQVEDLKKKIDDATITISKGRIEQNALKAADLTAKIRETDADIKTRDQALTTSGAKLLPMREQVNLRAAQYHARLARERKQWEADIISLGEERSALGNEQGSLKEDIKKARDEFQASQSEIMRLTTLIRSGVQALETLGLAGGETPPDGEKRIVAELADIETRGLDVERLISQANGDVNSATSLWQGMQRAMAENDSALNQAKSAAASEARERDELISDSNLATLAGASDFEPTRMEFASRCHEVIARQEDKLSDLSRRDLALEEEILRLESMETLAVDGDTRKLIDHYLARGFTEAEIKAFPEYLSALNSDPEVMAEYLKRDPGRFTGIMAATHDVIEKIKKIPSPEWLCRPVVISVPCDLEGVAEIESHVIAPEDADVYSHDYIVRKTNALNKEKETLEAEMKEARERFRSMAASVRKLDAYREKYPDTASVEALSHGVLAIEKEIAGLTKEISKNEKLRVKLDGEKAALEKEIQALLGRKATLTQQLQQVRGWLRQYGGMDTWRESNGREEQTSVGLKNKIIALENREKELGESINRLVEVLGRKKAEQRTLDEKAGNVPFSKDIILGDAHEKEAFSMDLAALEKLHGESLDCEQKVASELGIESLQKELENLRRKYQRATADLEQYQRDNDCDPDLSDHWASRESSERKERSAELVAVLDDTTGNRGVYSGKLEGIEEKLADSLKQQKKFAKNGIVPDIFEDDLASGDPEALLHGYRLEESQLREELGQLERRIPELENDVAQIKKWNSKIELGLARIKSQKPYWDENSPRVAWPETAQSEDPVTATQSFLKTVEHVIDEEGKAQSRVDSHRRSMSSAFERLQDELRDEKLQQRLPQIVDELRRHDTETLGLQSADLIEKCHNIAQNIESDLVRSEQFMNSLIHKLLDDAKKCHQKLQAATKIFMPEQVFIYGGNPILKCGNKLDFKRHDDIFRQSVEHWLIELIEQSRMPEVNSKAGNALASELLYRLLRAATGKKEFGIRLLKCDDTGKHYEQVGKDLGSGGEALTTAVLLYSLLTSMRQKRRNRRDDRLPAFLIADNPLGVCNRSDFLDAQLKVARAMGIQCVYFTGINDTESLGLFEHRVAIRKSGRKLIVDGNNYNMLEVIEQNVEKS